MNFKYLNVCLKIENGEDMSKSRQNTNVFTFYYYNELFRIINELFRANEDFVLSGNTAQLNYCSLLCVLLAQKYTSYLYLSQ